MPFFAHRNWLLLSQIYVLFGVFLQGKIIRSSPKFDKYQVWEPRNDGYSVQGGVFSVYHHIGVFSVFVYNTTSNLRKFIVDKEIHIYVELYMFGVSEK